MEIHRTLLSLIPLAGRSNASSEPIQPLQAPQPGQRLEARVLGQVGPNHILLEMSGKRLVAESQTSLRPGEHIRLEVLKSGPQPQLKVVSPAAEHNLPSHILRTILPQQIPLAEALQTLQRLSNDTATASRLPPPIRQHLDALLQALPNTTDLTAPEKLSRVLQQSGLFSEALAFRNSVSQPEVSIPTMDLKNQLLRLAATIRAARNSPRARAETTATPQPPLPASPSPALSQTQTHPTSFPTPNASPTVLPTPPQPPSAPPPQTLLPTPSQPAPSPSSGSLYQELPIPSPLPSVSPTVLPTPPQPPSAPPTQTPLPPPSQSVTPFQSGTTSSVTPQIPDTMTTSPAIRPLHIPKPSAPPSIHPSTPSFTDEELLKEIAHKVSGAIARIVVDQLASLPKPDSPNLIWHFDLPFREGEHIDTLRLVIHGDGRQRGAREQAQHPWSVDLEMEPAKLGKIRVRIVLLNNKISGYFWGERETTRMLFNQHLQQLMQRLQAAGLHPDHLQVVKEEIPWPQPMPGADSHLVDERI